MKDTVWPRSYSMNMFFGGVCAARRRKSLKIMLPPIYSRDHCQFLKAGSIPNPAGLFVTLDEHPDSINDGYFPNRSSPDLYGVERFVSY